MIKFFRRIRQKSITENKFSKYLIYAIGEIILVVIGILIALQINNYSEYKKERKLEIALLTNLSNEIDLDIKQIENNSIKSRERLNRLEQTLQLLNNLDSINKIDFIRSSYEFLIDNYFKSNSGIFDEAVSSGKMSYVQNEELRQNIFDYYRITKDSYTDATTQKVTDDLITPLVVESLLLNVDGFSFASIDVQDISSLKKLDFEALSNNKDFWKMVLLKFGSNREQMIRWKSMKQIAENVKAEIDTELKTLFND
ncbi:DUF6090 family protein [Winogradskyella sp. 3972H.M.0a.05]|uniref:DUF6090 family protein n=1 Tax=Winogradskyella sp. 3972H.M.0a.05 TaxID=2950277 RepID=UPI003392B16D